jgi:outer membrane protein assembly factor BamD (BamD/ComL family)
MPPGREASPGNASLETAARGDTDLANQNRLFAEAMDAREQGDLARAARLLDDFIRRYPVSPLTQDAYVERFRTLAHAGDRAAAGRAARVYLTLYGSGFARDEARAIALDVEP